MIKTTKKIGYLCPLFILYVGTICGQVGHSQPISFNGFPANNIYTGEFFDLNDHFNIYNAASGSPLVSEQLRAYPSSRHLRGSVLQPNLIVMNIEGAYDAVHGFPSALAAIEASEVHLELAKNWNYYMDFGKMNRVPTPTMNAMIDKWQKYNHTHSVRKLKTSAVSLMAQIDHSKPTNPPGFTGNFPNNTWTAPYITTQNNNATTIETTPASPRFYTYGVGTGIYENQLRAGSAALADAYYVHTDQNVLAYPTQQSNTPCSPSTPCYYDPSAEAFRQGRVGNLVLSPLAGMPPYTGPSPLSGHQPYYAPTFLQDGSTNKYYTDLLLWRMATPISANVSVPAATAYLNFLWENGEVHTAIPHHSWFKPYDIDPTSPFFSYNKGKWALYNAYKNDPYIKKYCLSQGFTFDMNPSPMSPPPILYLTSGGTPNYSAYMWYLHRLQSEGFERVNRLFTNVSVAPYLGTKIKNFSFYGFDAERQYGFDYEKTRKLQGRMRQQKYATPDFYPFLEMYQGYATARNGLNWIAQSRHFELMNEPARDEIVYDRTTKDYLFSPYVNAGSARFECLNMRPAQYLGLLKVLGVMGAEFYYAGYFGEFPAALFDTPSLVQLRNAYPQQNFNPENYIWQAAVASYAQGTMSRAQDFLIDKSTHTDPDLMLPNASSVLLQGDNNMQGSHNHCESSISPTAYSFNGTVLSVSAGSVNDVKPIIAVRRWGNKYLITATLQPANGAYGTNSGVHYDPSSAPNTTAVVSFNLPKQTDPNTGASIGTVAAGDFITVSMPVRRQGSTYIYDRTNANLPVFYQVDGWHQWQHPTHWSQDIEIEAELYDKCSNTTINAIRTDMPANLPSGTANYSNFVGYITGAGLHIFEYDFKPRVAGTYTVYTRAAGGGGARLQASIITKSDEQLVLSTTGISNISVPACSTAEVYSWHRFPRTFVVSQADIDNDRIFILQLGAVGTQAAARIDKFYITSSVPNLPNDQLANIGCNP